MSLVQIMGPQGSGKTTLGSELASRGYVVIDTDTFSGLGKWRSEITHEVPGKLPVSQFTEQWISEHEWVWDRDVVLDLYEKSTNNIIFLAGGAFNESDFLDLISYRFGIWVDIGTMISRLIKRDPVRWAIEAQEMKNAIWWNSVFCEFAQKQRITLIDGNKNVAILADEAERLTAHLLPGK
jgi:adenylate kinase family enzyme